MDTYELDCELDDTAGLVPVGMSDRLLIERRRLPRRAPRKLPRMLAVASNGGHWAQLRRIIDALHGFDVVYVTVDASYAEDMTGHRVHVVPDANFCDPIGCARMAWRMLCVLVRERPDVVISTGAAPGAAALFFARLLGSRTIWVDSIANAECMSMSGRLVRPFAGLWLTQWPGLAKPKGPEYAGRVL